MIMNPIDSRIFRYLGDRTFLNQPYIDGRQDCFRCVFYFELFGYIFPAKFYGVKRKNHPR